MHVAWGRVTQAIHDDANAWRVWEQGDPIPFSAPASELKARMLMFRRVRSRSLGQVFVLDGLDPIVALSAVVLTSSTG